MARVINLSDAGSLDCLSSEMRALENSLAQPILDATAHLKELVTFDAERAAKVLKSLGLNASQTPGQMNESLINCPASSRIIQKKFIDTDLSQKNLESILIEAVSAIKSYVPMEILKAIFEIVKSMNNICAYKRATMQYRDLVFKFFTKDQDDIIVLLVVNIHYDSRTTKMSLLTRALNYFSNRVHLAMFASTISTRTDTL